MLTVKQEWHDALTDEDKLVWAKKWGDLLVEDFQNPIWTSGFTQGQKELLEKIRGLKMGNPVTGDIPEELHDYATAVEVIKQTLKFISFNLIASAEVAEKISREELLEIAAKNISPVITNFIDVQAEEMEDGKINFVFNLVLVN